ncbi:MAG: hypothetical protein GXO91_05865 [FCB group bacterium]|nr:hypothetical protein [FCB group bacterium]
MSQKRIRKWFAGISLSIIAVIAGTILLFLLKPSLFIRDLEKKATALFPRSSKLTITIESFSGNFLKGFHFNEIELHKESELIGYAGESTANISLRDLLFGRIYFNKLTLTDCGINLDSLVIIKFNSLKKNSSNERFPFAVNRLEIDRATLRYRGTDLQLNLTGSLTTAYGPTLTIETADLQTEGLDDPVFLDGSILTLRGKNLEINPFNVYTRYRGKSLIARTMVRFINNDSGRVEVRFGGDTKYGEFKIKNMNGQGHIAENVLTIDTSYCEYETGSLRSSGRFDLKTRNWDISSRIDSVTIAGDSLYTNFGGDVTLIGRDLLKSLQATVNLQKVTVNEFGFSTIRGTLAWSDGKLVNVDTLAFSGTDYSGIISDLEVTSQRDMVITGKLEVAGLTLSTLTEKLPEVTTTGEGEFHFESSGLKKKFRALLRAESMSYGKLTTGKVICDIDYNSPEKKISDTNISGVIGDLSLVKKRFDKVLFIVSAKNGRIDVENIKAHNSEGDVLTFSGSIYDSLRVVEVDSLYGVLNTLDFRADKFTLQKNGDVYTLGNTILNIGEGTIGLSGEFKNLLNYQFLTDVNDLDIQLMNDFFRFNQLFQGTANGSFQISRSGGPPRVFSDVSISSGKLDNLDFNKLAGQFSFLNNRLLISDLSLDSHEGQLSIAGIINFSFEPGRSLVSAVDSLGVICKLDNFELDTFHRYFRWGLDTRGMISGDLSISGRPDSPKMLGNFTIDQPVFDRIKGKSVTGTFVYENQKAYFKSVKAILENGAYTVTGYIPANFDFVTADRKSAKNMPMDLMITGTATAIDFLQPYIESVDSLTGNFAMQMSISGTFLDPVRNGQVVLENGRISVLNLDNTFSSLNGYATIDDNKLTIKYLNGKSRGTVDDSNLWDSMKGFILRIFRTDEKPEDSPNLQVSGGMDLSQFFRPDYNLELTGEDLFLKSSENKFIGIGDAKIYVTGRDTVMVTGQFIPKPNEFLITDDFHSEASLKINRHKTGPVFGYDIHVPLDNVVRMENSFLQGFELDGDLTITAMGDSDFRFSGTVNIINGTFILNGTEYTNTTGSIFLDPSNTIPTVDIEALTSVNGNQYRIFFRGPLNDPNYEIRDEDTGSFITSDEQDAILRLLITGGSGNNGNIGETGKTLFSNYIENEFEQFIAQHSPIDRFQVESESALLTDFNKADVNISIAKNITQKLYMNIRSDVFSDQITNEYEVGYRINRNMSLVGRLDQNGLPHMNYRIKIDY